MADTPGTSFIPKRPVQGRVKARGVRRVYILAYVSYVLFFGTLIATGGVFFYKLSVESQLQAQKQQLAEERQSFSQSDIERVREMERRIIAANNKLDLHVSVHKLFSALEASALQTIQFSGFALDRLNSNVLKVSMSAVTEDFNSVLFQREVLSSSQVFNDADFTNVSITTESQESGAVSVESKSVSFVVETELEPSVVLYEPVRGATAQPTPAETSETGSEDDVNSFIE